jgi:sugar lactone lactonase YvrE
MWDVDAERLYWVDSLGRRIFRATPDGRELEAWDAPANIGSICITRSGQLLGAMKSGLHLIDLASNRFDLIIHPEADLPDNTLNDGKVDRSGRLWFGSMNLPRTQPNASLYRLDPDLSLQKVFSGITVSNGPCWSPDDKTFYFADSATASVAAYEFDLEKGTLSNGRTLVERRRIGPGLVDGATVDSEGGLWCAHVYGGCVARYTPDGLLDREIEFPTPGITSVMFGGEGLEVLYVTSRQARRGEEDSDGPLAGALFAVHELGIKGMPEAKFG